MQVTTTSAIEWAFVATPDRPPAAGWPAETRNTHVGEGSIMRAPMDVHTLQARTDATNTRLALLGEPELALVESIGSRMYTGPCFAKYNSVLRGLKTDVVFLRNQMIELCCSRQVRSKRGVCCEEGRAL